MSQEAARQQIIKSLVPLIPQLSGSPMSSSSRNVALVDRSWFEKFAEWIKTGKGYPGPIRNEPLRAKISEKKKVVAGTDYETVETNVWDAMSSVFSGGPVILRPFMQHPLTKEAQVVMVPLKFTILVDGKAMTRTADPEWTVSDFKACLAEKLKFDVARTKIRAGGDTVDDGMKVGAVPERYGTELILDKPLTAGSLTTDITGGKPFLGMASASLKSTSEHSMGSATSLSKGYQSTVVAMFSAFVQVISQVGPVKDIVMSAGELDEGTVAGMFLAYLNEFRTAPNSIPQSMGLYAAVARENPQFAQLRYFDSAALVHAFFVALSGSLPVGHDLETIIGNQAEVSRKCPKCGNTVTETESTSCLKVDIPSKWFRKPSIEDCIGGYEGETLSGKWECPKCHKQVEPKQSAKFISLGKILVVSLTRFIRDGTNVTKKFVDINYSTKLSLSGITKKSTDNYNLVGVVAHGGQAIHYKFKSFAFRKDLNSWVFFTESKMRQADAKAAIIPNTSLIFVYERCE